MRRLVVAVCMLVAAPVQARTIVGALGDAQERVGLRPRPAFTNFAQHFGALMTAPSLTSPTSAALAGGAAIDSSMSLLGPIFLDHADTLGVGRTNVNVIGQRSFADASLFSQPFNELGLNAPLNIVKRTSTGDPSTAALLGIRLRYAVDVHVWAAAIAVSHGFTDNFDASLVLPIIHTRLDCAVFARIVKATGPQGGAFEHVPGAPTLGGSIEPVDSTGIGDLVVRGKYKLAVPAPWKLALTLETQFPTGDEFQLHGTGDYWLTPGVDLALPLWNERGELDAHAALNFAILHSRQSQALYGVSASAVLWPKHLGAIVEFLGASQFDSAFAPNDTDVLVLTPGGITLDPLLGVGWNNRLDQFNFSFGLRAIIGPGLVLFANGVVALNPHEGVRPAGVVPTIGLGWTF